MGPNDRSTNAPWLQPPEQESLKRYVDVIRERLWLVLLAVVITTGGAVLYLALADKTYVAEADVLVTPVPEGSDVLTSLGLITRSSDPLRETETGARLIENHQVAEATVEELEGVPAAPQNADAMLEAVTSEPVAESSIVAIQAESTNAETAAAIANTFADTALRIRSESLQDRVDDAIESLESTLEGTAGDERTTAILQTQLAQLQSLKGQSDPTMTVETRAEPPNSPVSPKPLLSVLGAIIAGLVLGIGAAFAYRLLDPRIRRDEQIQQRFQLPILARIPRDPRGGRNVPIPPRELAPATQEAYRVLRNTLGMFQPPGATKRARSILVTSADSGAGKSTTTLGLATSLAAAGRSVIVIEGDLRRPGLGRSLQLASPLGVVSVLVGDSTIQQALVPSPNYGNNLQLLLADHTGPATTELFSLPSAQQLIADASQMADFVVIDSAPMNIVVDTMPLAKVVDDLVICVRLGKTRIDHVTRLGELLAEYDVKPSGFAVVGTEREPSSYYHRGRQPLASKPDPAAQAMQAQAGTSEIATGASPAPGGWVAADQPPS